jgi:hypothetical protein
MCRKARQSVQCAKPAPPEGQHVFAHSIAGIVSNLGIVFDIGRGLQEPHWFAFKEHLK